MKKSLSVFAVAVGLSALLSVSLASEAMAQEEAQEDEEVLEGIVEVEEFVVTGSRAQSRTVTDSPVPIDVIGADEFAKQGGADLADLVRNVVPSYNVNTQPISDAGTVVRPPNMRGLAPDHALVLGQRQAPPSRCGDPLAGQWRRRWRAGSRLGTHPGHRAQSSGSPARRRVGPVRLGRHCRRVELPPQGSFRWSVD